KGLKLMLGSATFAMVLLITSCGDDDNHEDALDSIVEIAGKTNDLSTLVAALNRFPDLVSTLSDENESFTVFAPTNASFAALLEATGQTSLDDIPDNVLRRVLEYHVVSGSALVSSSLTDGATATTVLGENISVGVD
ncbi:MAG: fasciclin, partial [Phototrophicales bacterium]